MNHTQISTVGRVQAQQQSSRRRRLTSALVLGGALLVSSSAYAARTVSVDGLVGTYAGEPGNGLARGWSLANIDGTAARELALSAPNHGQNGADSGQVYLFLNPGVTTKTGTLASTASLILSGEAGSQLGASVASGGDLNGDGIADLAISAPGWNSGTGRVYVFFGRSSWTGVTLASADLVLSGEQAGQQFGAGVAFPGDLNGDARQDLLISSPGRDVSSTARDRGAVYVFLGNSLAWSTRTLATADAVVVGDNNADGVGTTLAGIGDVNGDGLADWATGAPKNDDAGTDAGQVYTFFGSTAYVLGETAASTASVRVRGDVAGDQFGASLVGGGDLNGDGVADFYAGAPLNDSNGTDAGRAYVVTGRKRDWPFGAVLAKDISTISFIGTAAGEQIGADNSLVVAEISGDNLPDILLGSRPTGSEAGVVYTFLGRTSGWGLANSVAGADITLQGSAAGDKLGFMTGTSGDLDGDVRSDILLGASGSDMNGTDSGEVFVGSNLQRWLDLDADGYTPAEGDCDDHEATANPGVTTDDKDGIDNDCDGQVDEDASGGCGGKVEGLTSRANALPVVGGFGLLALAMRRRRNARR